MSHASSLYADTALPYPDAKVAFELCHGGPIKYKLADGCGVSDEWVANSVMPNTSAVFSSKLGSNLGRALLWACYDDKAKESIDSGLRNKVIAAYDAATQNNAIVAAAGLSNPVIKVRLVLHEKNGTAVIEELRSTTGTAAVDAAAAATSVSGAPQNDGVRRTKHLDAGCSIAE
jgi:hypothetical protein